MQEPLNSEVVKLLFHRIDEKFADLKEVVIKGQDSTDRKINELNNKIETTNEHFDERVGKLETAYTKVAAVWSAGVLLVAFLFNKFL